MSRRKFIGLICLLLVTIAGTGLFPVTARAQQTGKFVLVAEAGGQLLIAPEYVTYQEGQSIGAALQQSGHEFIGLSNGWITEIDGVSGNFTRGDQNGSYNLTADASTVTHFYFVETNSYKDGIIDADIQRLMTVMADYLTKEDDVQKAAKEDYKAAKKAFVGISPEDARAYAHSLSNAMKDYEDSLKGTQYEVTFSDGNIPYTGAEISLTNEYGRTWSASSGGTLTVPVGRNYTFRINQNGAGVFGTVTITENTTITASLPNELWMKELRLSGIGGDEYSEEHKFEDEEFTVSRVGRNATVPVSDTFVGAVYTYATCESKDPLYKGKNPVLTAIYQMRNNDKTDMERAIPFDSLNSSINSVLARGSEGNTVIYRITWEGSTGYTYFQDYTVEFQRIPTLTGIVVKDQVGTDQAATDAFDGSVTAYDYMVLDTVKMVYVSPIPLMEDYQIRLKVNDQYVQNGVAVSGQTEIQVEVSSGGMKNTYMLNIQPGEGKTMTFTCDSDVSVHVENQNGVVMPYTKFAEGTKKRYLYTLVPNVEYHYIATRNGYYHMTNSFVLDEKNKNIDVKFPDNTLWLQSLAFGSKYQASNKNTLLLDQSFTPENHSYEITYTDAKHNVFVWIESAQGVTVEAIYNQISNTSIYHGKEWLVPLYSEQTTGAQLPRFLMPYNPLENDVTIRLTKYIDGVCFYQDYEVKFKRSLTLNNITAQSDGEDAVLIHENGTRFVPEIKEYDVRVSMAATELVLNFERYTDNFDTNNPCYGEPDAGYRVKWESADGTVDVTDQRAVRYKLNGTMETESIEITVENEKAPNGSSTYRVNILKSPPVITTFVLNPEDALLNISQKLSEERIWPNEDGTFSLCEGYEYNYAVTKYGYVSRSGILNVTRNAANRLVITDGEKQHPVDAVEAGGVATIEMTLAEPQGQSIVNPNIIAQWPNFRGNNDNNAVTDYKIPTTAESGTLYWANKLGDGIDSGAVGSPIIVDDYIITYAGDRIYRVDPFTGKTVAQGKMHHTSSFSITPPTYWKGMIFVALSDGCVQAFDAVTLKSLWIYQDQLKGQPNSPITVHDGYLYTGFWNGENKRANFVCLSVTDEDPSRTDEEKQVSWFYTSLGGYYWAGAYVCDDFVLVGTDDGTNACNSPTSSLLMLDAKTGKCLDSLNGLNGDIRSTVVRGDDGNFYFTSKGGTFYCVGAAGGRLTMKWKVNLYNGDKKSIPMSTSTPVVYNGRAYVGVSGFAQFEAFSGHNITVIDLDDKCIAYTVDTLGYPQTSGLLTRAYGDYVYVYFFDNYTPGTLRAIRDQDGQSGPDRITMQQDHATAYALFTPSGDHAQYAICSPIVDKYGTVYFKNDSAHLMAFGSAIVKLEVNEDEIRTSYKVGETFDPTNMVVTAVYANGNERDITKYVSYNTQPLTKEDKFLTISFTYGDGEMYHNEEQGMGMSTVSTQSPSVNIGLNITSAILGDADGNGQVEEADTQMILDWEAQLLTREPALTLADVNGDKKVDSDDAVLILQKLQGMITSFPGEKTEVTPEN